MIRRLVCKLWGHVEVPAATTGPWVMPDAGLVHSWRPVADTESRGIGCVRCGRYVEHDWVRVARAAGMPT